MSRDKRCCVLFASNASANLITPGFASISAIPRAISCFGEAMFFELKKNVDVTVWEPLGAIKSESNLIPPPDSICLTEKQAVSDIFDKIGVRKTHGSLMFAMLMPFM